MSFFSLYLSLFHAYLRDLSWNLFLMVILIPNNAILFLIILILALDNGKYLSWRYNTLGKDAPCRKIDVNFAISDPLSLKSHKHDPFQKINAYKWTPIRYLFPFHLQNKWNYILQRTLSWFLPIIAVLSSWINWYLSEIINSEIVNINVFSLYILRKAPCGPVILHSIP